MVTTTSIAHRPVNFLWLRSRLAELTGQAQGWFIGGTVVSLLGFVLPWFKHRQSSQWWYSGWQLCWNEGLAGIIVLFVGYVALLLAGFFLLDREIPQAAATIVLTLAVTLGTLAVLAIAVADALDGIRSMSRPIWNIGLPVMFLGHATMLVAGFVALALRIVDELVVERSS